MIGNDKSPRHRITMAPEDAAKRNARIARAVGAGVPISRAATRFGLRPATVSRICRDMGVEPAKTGARL